jgi:hypothetical protein
MTLSRSPQGRPTARAEQSKSLAGRSRTSWLDCVQLEVAPFIPARIP